MRRTNEAIHMSFDDLVNFAKLEKPNPTVDGLVFMDCAPNPKGKNQRGLFACYITGLDEDPKTGNVTALQIGLLQWVKGIPQVVLVKISKEQIKSRDKVRFWNQAPSHWLLDEYPFPVPSAISAEKEQKEEKKET